MPPPEYWWVMAAMAAGTFIAVFMPKPRKIIIVERFIEPENEDVTHPAEAFHQGVLPMFEEKNADLVKRLREVAQKAARERLGGITSADVIAALERDDPIMHKRLQIAERRIMGAVFVAGWVQTGEWRPTGSRGRPQRVWTLKDQMAETA
jgi:hypothetical protein